MQIRALGMCLAAMFAIAAASSRSAHADASCTSLVSGLKQTLDQSGGRYSVRMTIHRTDIDTVAYGDGIASANTASWPLFFSTTQLFADRLPHGSSQPFDVNAGDRLRIWISTTGLLYIVNDTWNFTVQYDMACSNNTMTRNIPGLGVTTLTFRWFAPIP